MLTDLHKKQIEEQGMSPATIEEQIRNFEQGFPYLNIYAAATPGDGIMVLDEKELERFLDTYQKYSKGKVIFKFVPASGAASRMFKDLYAFLDNDTASLDADPITKQFIDNLSSFAFYEDLDNSLKASGSSIEKALATKDYKLIIRHLLEDEGLGYGSLPKGLLKFHRYDEGSRTPVEEHFVEGAQYGLGKGNTVRLHFTVSPEHQEKFEEKIADIQPAMEARFNVNFEVTFSQQKKTTDTIAVNMDNMPFTEENGEILFRPAGHGALLENLNDIDADLVFIKNIDNVVPDRLKGSTETFKKAIGGILLDAQDRVFSVLEKLEADADEALIIESEGVYTQILGAKLPDFYHKYNLAEKAAYLKKKLNRPIRVCGMVENTGEPGGGPFWVKEADGSLSLQIGETAQLNLDDPHQQGIFQSSSHFNPTDLVCSVKDYKGKKFNLLEYRNPKTGFITQKSKNGKDLKAQELPGLWNGSMDNWNSIFVEVPLITFNPVKTINDLLRDVHQ
ncbi:DUF4301 family protein [Negadavirga shengliensis]|uniref:DUF4301 family protein n=1 Tax=Negadavirga shengliensis TaxID=1389218 RepID=A0ABV9T3J2_9BACT